MMALLRDLHLARTWICLRWCLYRYEVARDDVARAQSAYDAANAEHALNSPPPRPPAPRTLPAFLLKDSNDLF